MRYLLIVFLITLKTFSQTQEITYSSISINGFDQVEFYWENDDSEESYGVLLRFENPYDVGVISFVVFEEYSNNIPRDFVIEINEFINDLKDVFEYLEDPKNDFITLKKEDYKLSVFNESSFLRIYTTEYNYDTDEYDVNMELYRDISKKDVLKLIKWLSNLSIPENNEGYEIIEHKERPKEIVLSNFELDGFNTIEFYKEKEGDDYNYVVYCGFNRNKKFGNIYMTGETIEDLKKEVNTLISSFKDCLNNMNEEKNFLFKPKDTYGSPLCILEPDSNNSILLIYNIGWNEDFTEYYKDENCWTTIKKTNLELLINWLEGLGFVN